MASNRRSRPQECLLFKLSSKTAGPELGHLVDSDPHLGGPVDFDLTVSGLGFRTRRRSPPNLETTPSAAVSSRRFRLLCTPRSFAIPVLLSSCHTRCFKKLEHVGQQSLFWILISLTPVLHDFVHEPREDL